MYNKTYTSLTKTEKDKYKRRIKIEHIFGNIKTNLDDIYHNRLKEIFNDVAQALSSMRDNEHFGKLILKL